MDDVEHIADRMERAGVQRRRRAEVERRERIFNEKWRTIGVRDSPLARVLVLDQFNDFLSQDTSVSA